MLSAKSNVQTQTFSDHNFKTFYKEDFEIEWIIKRSFLNIHTHLPGMCVESPIIPNNGVENVRWQIVFYPCVKTQNIDKYCSIELRCLWKKTEIPISTMFRLWINIGSNCIFDGEYKHVFKNYETYKIENFMKMHKLELQSLSDLTITAKVSSDWELNKISLKNKLKSEINLLKNYDNLFKDGTFSDIILCTEKDGHEFKVHRCILASQSKVFAAMLCHEMQENLTGRIIVHDFLSTTINALLNFIYSGKIKFENVETTLNLLAACEKYDIMDLKRHCIEYLTNKIDENNVCDILLQADIYNAQELKTVTLKYICDNREKFSDKEKFSVLKQNPELLTEIITQFADNLKISRIS